MTILGIETSCDETAASVVKDGRQILSHVVASSADMHTKSGGVIPENAAREQVKSIIPVIQETLLETIKLLRYEDIKGKGAIASPQHSLIADFVRDKIDAIAITAGPGLIGSLLVGVETAKTLAAVWNKPIVPVNHLVGHIYANMLVPENTVHSTQYTENNPKFPAIALVVSGGHTDLVLMKGHRKLEYIGGTRDDAAGEAFDKTARLLGLPYPGGPSIAAKAAKYKIENLKFKIRLPRPMIEEDNFDFSFSGLKTAVLREVNKLKDAQQFNNITIQQLSYDIQEAITDVLVEKSLRAVKQCGVKTFLLAGGVAANKRLTEKFKFEIGHLDFDIDFRVPLPKFCTDNASYIAACAEYNYHPVPWKKISANPGLTIMDNQ